MCVVAIFLLLLVAGEPYPIEVINIFNITEIDLEILELSQLELVAGGSGNLSVKIGNFAEQTDAVISVDLPEGWWSSPEEMNVSLPPGNSSYNLRIFVPGEVIGGNYKITVHVSSGSFWTAKSISVNVKKEERFLPYILGAILFVTSAITYSVWRRRATSYKRRAITVLRHVRQRMR
jgi:uncharacterized membrane protein